MLMVGECEGQGATQAAQQFHFSRQRYYQLLEAFEAQGALGLALEQRGPKTDYRRTDQMIRLVIRHRFLDAEASAEVIAQKLRQQGNTLSQRSVERIIADYGLKKKLYALNPAHSPQYVQVRRSRGKERTLPADPASLERQVRQLLADKVSGNQVGIWLLVAEHLRLGTWDLLLHWSQQPAQRVEPRLALHLVNEAALCLCSYRNRRTLSQKGFELANGLPFVPTDAAIHDLLDRHTVLEAQEMQIALGKLRRAGDHFGGQLLAMDPHRMTSYTKRQMRRHRFSAREKPAKMGQTFFLLDCQTGQPVCFTLASAAQSVLDASPALLRMGAEILGARADAPSKPLVLTDKEHYSEELFRAVKEQGWFDLLAALPAYGQMTMALLAQAAIYQLRQRLGPPVAQWDSAHLAHNLFQGLEGDIRVKQDTIVVTFYNAPNVELLRAHYENLPAKLQRQSVDPRIPWLYNFKLDFRFK
jgi:transposase